MNLLFLHDCIHNLSILPSLCSHILCVLLINSSCWYCINLNYIQEFVTLNHGHLELAQSSFCQAWPPNMLAIVVLPCLWIHLTEHPWSFFWIASTSNFLQTFQLNKCSSLMPGSPLHGNVCIRKINADMMETEIRYQ